MAPSAAAVTASLGDSYSSGQGSGNYDFATKHVVGNSCHRSPNAWPRLLGVPKSAHFACSGAQTRDFFGPQKSGPLAGPDRTSQLDRLQVLVSSQPVSRVYVTIGGNDLGFAKIIVSCVIGSCLRHMDEVELPRLHNSVQPKVIAALTAVKRIAGPDVVLVGYPDLIPAVEMEMNGCWWFSGVERTRVRRLEGELDASQAAAAAAVGISYVSIRSALNGHELCTAGTPWINPIARLTSLLSAEQGHPTAAGQRAIAEQVRDALAPPPGG